MFLVSKQALAASLYKVEPHVSIGLYLLHEALDIGSDSFLAVHSLAFSCGVDEVVDVGEVDDGLVGWLVARSRCVHGAFEGLGEAAGSA